jgi:hypothetical protein
VNEEEDGMDAKGSWALMELMGHRQVPGFVDEVELAGAKFLRVRVPQVEAVTGALRMDRLRLEQIYSPGAVYAITPTTEKVIADLLLRDGRYLPALPPPGSDLPVSTRMQGVDCPECEDGTPHTHGQAKGAEATPPPSPTVGDAPGDEPMPF